MGGGKNTVGLITPFFMGEEAKSGSFLAPAKKLSAQKIVVRAIMSEANKHLPPGRKNLGGGETI